MRQLLLMLLFIPTSLIAKVNEYESIVDDSKTWTNVHSHFAMPPSWPQYRYEEYRLEGDTTINGIGFKQILSRYNGDSDRSPDYLRSSEWTEWTPQDGYIGQEGDKVYYADQSHFYAIMDFSLSKGDEFAIDAPLPLHFVVTAVSDTILEASADQKKRRCLYLQEADGGSNKTVWVEGIGSVGPGGRGLLDFRRYNLSNDKNQLFLCTKDDTPLYEFDIDLRDKYYPILYSEKRWVFRETASGPSGDIHSYSEYRLDGDNEIGGVYCMQIYRRENAFSGSPEALPETGWTEWEPVGGYIGETYGQVFSIDETGTSTAIFNFFLNKGDVFNGAGAVHDYVVTLATDTTLTASSWKSRRKCLHLERVSQPGQSAVWVEGIGSVGPGGRGFLETSDSPSSELQLVRYYEEGSLLYQYAEAVPTPVQGVSTLAGDSPARLYDLQGRRLSAPPAKGVFIVNGQKVVKHL